MGHAVVGRRRDHRRTRDARCRSLTAKSECELPHRAHAARRAEQEIATMKITLIGAAGGEVTGSGYIVQTKQARILVDCGLFQGGKRSEALNRPPTSPDRRLDAVLLTHGHLDHTGRLALLAKMGYAGPIYGTP